MTVSVYEARTNFSALLDQIEKSKDSITITRHNQAVARLVAIERPKRSTVHKELRPSMIKETAFFPTEAEWNNV